MPKPIINKVPVFDADTGHEITYTYTGNNQPYGDMIYIYKTSTNELIYSAENVYKDKIFTHTIPASSISNLSNGVSYAVQISVIERDKTMSPLSDKVFFTCYSNPIFKFNNDSDKITASSYQANVIYTQEQSRDLKTYCFYLYDVTEQQVLHTSNLFFYKTGDEISYTYRSLQNASEYKIRCVGETIDGLMVKTDFVRISASYHSSNGYTTLNLTNNPYGGYIQVNTNIVAISGDTTGDVTLNNGAACVNNAEGCITYQEGFIVNGDNVWILKLKNPPEDTLVAYQTNNINTIELFYHRYEDFNYFRLMVSNGLSNYMLYSDRFQMLEDESITLYITRQNDLYQLDLVHIE